MSSPEGKSLPAAAGLLETDAAAGDTAAATVDRKSSSTWFALRNPVFCRLWFATLLSGTFVSSQDVVATWLMHDLGASPFLL
ncbi:MAG: hypothetical protein WCA06_17495, partial [Terrimicrobiaceae bacterium]